VDVSPEGDSLRSYQDNFAIMTDKLLEKQQELLLQQLIGHDGKIVLIAAQRIAFRRNIHIMKAVIRLSGQFCHHDR
jgi:hypothetical protein